MPYLARVFRYRAVARKCADPGQIEYSLSRPHFRMLVLSSYLRLSIDIRSEIRHQEIVIATDQHVAHPSEQSWLAGAESIGRKLIQHPFQSRVSLVIVARPVCASQRQILDLFG